MRNSCLLAALLCTMLVKPLNLRAQTAALSADIKPYQGKPTIFLNGTPEAPVFYALTDVPGGRWSWEEIPQQNLRNFCEAGVRLFQLDLFLEHLWVSPDNFSLEKAKRQIRGVLDVCPTGAVVFRLHLNPPAWWLQQNPGEQVAYETGVSPEPFQSFSLSRIVQDDARLPVRNSLASEKWRKEAGERLRQFCRLFSQTEEGKALVGVHVACGVYGEWHQWGFIQHESDFSLPMQRHFQQWLRMRYSTESSLQKHWNDPAVSFESAAIPTPEERSIAGGHLFRKPQTGQKAMDYYRCQHELVVDDILYFCQIVKETWGRPILTGAFYGYFFSVFNRQAAGGHLELQRVLKSQWIDYLSGPQVYYPDDGYDPGEPYRSRSLVRSVQLHGKLWLDEYDQQPRRTYPVLNGKDNAENYRKIMQENVAALRRNVLSPLMRGAGLWFYDFGPGGMNLHRKNEHDIQSGTTGYWDHPIYRQEIMALKRLADSLLHQPWKPEADVLLVFDTEVFYHLKSTLPDSCPVSSQVVDWLPLALHYAGVAFDAVHLDDLETLDVSPYRAVIFANTWLLDERDVARIREKIAQDNRHLFWLYAPGYVNATAIDPTAPAAITGIGLRQLSCQGKAVALFDSLTTRLAPQAAWGILDPLFAIEDGKAEPLAHFAHNPGSVAFGKKRFERSTAWFFSIPPIDVAWWRRCLSEAGAHIYNVYGDVVYCGNGIVALHTKTGGVKRLTLKNGRIIELDLPVGPATVVVDGETGRRVY
jgi:hypothetical protein